MGPPSLCFHLKKGCGALKKSYHLVVFLKHYEWISYIIQSPLNSLPLSLMSRPHSATSLSLSPLSHLATERREDHRGGVAAHRLNLACRPWRKAPPPLTTLASPTTGHERRTWQIWKGAVGMRSTGGWEGRQQQRKWGAPLPTLCAQAKLTCIKFKNLELLWIIHTVQVEIPIRHQFCISFFYNLLHVRVGCILHGFSCLAGLARTFNLLCVVPSRILSHVVGSRKASFSMVMHSCLGSWHTGVPFGHVYTRDICGLKIQIPPYSYFRSFPQSPLSLFSKLWKLVFLSKSLNHHYQWT